MSRDDKGVRGEGGGGGEVGERGEGFVVPLHVRVELTQQLGGDLEEVGGWVGGWMCTHAEFTDPPTHSEQTAAHSNRRLLL